MLNNISIVLVCLGTFATLLFGQSAFAAPRIASNISEPLSHEVSIFLKDLPNHTDNIQWFIDLKEMPYNNSNEFVWDTFNIENGEHLILARISLPGERTLDVRRTFVVSNSRLKIDFVDFRCEPRRDCISQLQILQDIG